MSARTAGGARGAGARGAGEAGGPGGANAGDAGDGTRTVRVDYLARVEGEGGLQLRMRGGEVTGVELRIFEPPRFFEAFLRGRRGDEAPDITSRICGICPIAYQMSALHAVESAFGVRVEGTLRDLRRLIYCGEWIESHVLHMALLHAPDFLGYDSAIHMARDHREVVELALRLKKAGNAIVALLGGREIHPVNLRVGGFYRVPRPDELARLVPELEWGREAARRLLAVAAGFTFPDFERDYEFVSLRHATGYPIDEGRIVSTVGIDIDVREYEQVFEEEHVRRSTALHSRIRGRGAYATGPLARFNLNADRLPPEQLSLAAASGLTPGCRNPFRSILARGIEVIYAVEEALAIIARYRRPEAPAVPFTPRTGTGWGATEAPRGLLYHRYRLDSHGVILDAKIVPPTSQNQKTIEDDLREFAPRLIDLSHEEMRWRCEQAVRNYDPCISCSTHFLTLDLVKE